MDQFSFFMGFYGLLLGLAVSELLLGFGNLARARRQPRWGLLTPLLGLDIFIQIVATFADAWRRLQSVTIDFAGITGPALIGICFLLAALMSVPRDIADWPDLDEYFFARRRITIGAVLAPNLLTIVFVELGSVIANGLAAQLAYWLINGVLTGLLIVAVSARRRGVVIAALAGNAALLVLLYATSINIAAWVKLLFGL